MVNHNWKLQYKTWALIIYMIPTRPSSELVSYVYILSSLNLIVPPVIKRVNHYQCILLFKVYNLQAGAEGVYGEWGQLTPLFFNFFFVFVKEKLFWPYLIINFDPIKLFWPQCKLILAPSLHTIHVLPKKKNVYYTCIV